MDSLICGQSMRESEGGSENDSVEIENAQDNSIFSPNGIVNLSRSSLGPPYPHPWGDLRVAFGP